MAVTRLGRSITFTAAGDAYPGIVFLNGLSVRGTGMTPGDRLQIQDTQGDIIADYNVGLATDYRDLLSGCSQGPYQGMKIVGPVAGAWTVTAFLE